MLINNNYILRGRLFKKIIKLPLAFINGVICLFLPKNIIAIIPNHSIGVCIYYAENIISYIEKNNIQKDSLTVYTGNIDKDCNKTIMKLYSRELNIKRSPFIYWLLSNGGIEGLEIFNRSVPKFITGVFYSGLIGEKVNISFLSNEINENWILLSKIGVNRGDKIALVSTRSNLYWSKKGFKNNLAEQIRNSSFEKLSLSIEYLNESNFKVIRVGDYDDENNQEKYISLNSLNEYERDIIDVFLHSIADLVICGPSGLAYLGSVFSKPTLIHNMIPIGEVPTILKSVVIPKKIIDKNTQKTIAYSEYKNYKKKIITDDYIFPRIVNFTLINFRDENLYEEFGLGVVENSSEEIYAGLLEVINTAETQLLGDERIAKSEFYTNFKCNKLMNNFGGIFSPSFIAKQEECVINERG